MGVDEDLSYGLDDADLDGFTAGESCCYQVRLKPDLVTLRNYRSRQSIGIFDRQKEPLGLKFLDGRASRFSNLKSQVPFQRVHLKPRYHSEWKDSPRGRSTLS